MNNHLVVDVWSLSTRQENRGPIIGIDLGTSTSCIAIWDATKSRAKVIKNSTSGKRTTPSVLLFDGSFSTPTILHNDTMPSSSTVVANWKRLLSCSKDELSPGIMKNLHAEIDDSKFLPCIRCELIAAKKTAMIPLEVLSSHVLKDLKISAENYLKKNKELAKLIGGDIVQRAVIGVPAYFPSSGVDATRNAALLAGFTSVSFLAESTAAAMCYGLLVAGAKTVLVFDMGGGTLDITIMRIDNGNVVHSVTLGDALCGGQDIDNALSVLIFQKLKDSNIDMSAVDEPILRRVAKKYKEILSTEMEVAIVFDHFEFLKSGVKQGSIPAINLARYELDLSIQDILVKLSRLIHSAVQKWREEVSNLRFNFVSEVEEVVLVGGSSKIPVVQTTIRKSLLSLGEHGWESNEFCSAVNPEHAVAEGLAIRGAVEMGYEIDGLKSVLMMDTIPNNLGILTKENGDNMFYTLISKGTKLPCSSATKFKLGDIHQKQVTLSIYEERGSYVIENTDEKADIPLTHIATEDFLIPSHSCIRVDCWVYVHFSVSDSGKLKVTVSRDGNEEDALVVSNTINNLWWSSSENILLIVSIVVFFAIYLFVKINLPLADLPSYSAAVEDYQRSTSIITSLDGDEF